MPKNEWTIKNSLWESLFMSQEAYIASPTSPFTLLTTQSSASYSTVPLDECA